MPVNQAHNEKELLQRIAEGEEQAFRAFYDIYERLLKPYLTELTKSESISGDLIQETLLRVWLNRERISQLDHHRAYIYRIAANLSYTWLKNQLVRKRLEQVAVQDSSTSDDSETLSSLKDLQGIIRQAVKDMPLQRRRIYLMHREQGMKAAEIAQKLGVSV